jgi:regulator of sigma E protease
LIQSSGFLWTILFFVVAISPLVFLHELGHYLVGRWCGVHAEAFSIGFGRAIAKWTDKRGTVWQIGWLPLGGYVRFAGDMGVSSQADPEWLKLPAEERNRTFPSKPVWQRALIVLAGPMTNFLVAIVMLIGLFSLYGEIRIAPQIGDFAKQSVAYEAGMRKGDRIVSVAGQPIAQFEDIGLYVQPRAGQPTPFEIDRNGARQTITVTPRLETFKDFTGAEVSTGRIGIAPLTYERVRIAPQDLPGAALRFTGNSVKTMAVVLGQTITGNRSVKELGGPVKLATVSNKVAALGFVSFLFFMVMVSINLGFINLLPIPMLDGGHLLFYAAEAIRGKPVPQQTQEWAYRTGLAALLTFMLVVTVNDLAGLGLWRGIAGLIG